MLISFQTVLLFAFSLPLLSQEGLPGDSLSAACLPVEGTIPGEACVRSLEEKIAFVEAFPSRVNGLRLESELARLVSRISAPGKTGIAWASILRATGKTKMLAGSPKEAEAHYQQAYAALLQAVGADDPRLAGFLLDSVDVLIGQAAYGEAEPLVSRAIQLSTAAKHDRLILESLLRSAAIQRSQSAFAKARETTQQAIAHAVKAFGPNSAEHGRALLARAEIGTSESRFDEAEKDAQDGLAMIEAVRSPGHPAVAEALSSLGGALFNRGKFAAAKPQLERALEIRASAFGAEHPLTTVVSGQLADLSRATGDWDTAEKIATKVLEIRERTLGPEHPDVGWSLNLLGEIYRLQGRYRESEPVYQRALRIRTMVYGPVSHQVAITSHNLGLLYHIQGREELAEPLFLEALRGVSKGPW